MLRRGSIVPAPAAPVGGGVDARGRDARCRAAVATGRAAGAARVQLDGRFAPQHHPLSRIRPPRRSMGRHGRRSRGVPGPAMAAGQSAEPHRFELCGGDRFFHRRGRLARHQRRRAPSRRGTVDAVRRGAVGSSRQCGSVSFRHDGARAAGHLGRHGERPRPLCRRPLGALPRQRLARFAGDQPAGDGGRRRNRSLGRHRARIGPLRRGPMDDLRCLDARVPHRAGDRSPCRGGHGGLGGHEWWRRRPLRRHALADRRRSAQSAVRPGFFPGADRIARQDGPLGRHGAGARPFRGGHLDSVRRSARAAGAAGAQPHGERPGGTGEPVDRNPRRRRGSLPAGRLDGARYVRLRGGTRAGLQPRRDGSTGPARSLAGHGDRRPEPLGGRDVAEFRHRDVAAGAELRECPGRHRRARPAGAVDRHRPRSGPLGGGALVGVHDADLRFAA